MSLKEKLNVVLGAAKQNPDTAARIVATIAIWLVVVAALASNDFHRVTGLSVTDPQSLLRRWKLAIWLITAYGIGVPFVVSFLGVLALFIRGVLRDWWQRFGGL